MKDVVFLHGWGMNAAVFGPLQDRLSGRYPAHALDLPGYNGEPACEPYTLEALAGRIATVAPARCAVVGWSLGALVALVWAASARAQVQKLVLIAATPCFVQREDWACAIDAAMLLSFSESLRSDRAATINRFITLQARGDSRARSVARALRADACAGVPASAAALEAGLDILLHADLRPLLPAVDQPTLVIHGDRDGLAPAAAGARLAQTLRHGQLEIIADAGHVPFVSRACRVATRIASFLG